MELMQSSSSDWVATAIILVFMCKRECVWSILAEVLMSRVRSSAIVFTVQFLWNCRKAEIHIISPLAIDGQLNFLIFRRLYAVVS
jgi:uncharacterized protein involved in propanediol utilization